MLAVLDAAVGIAVLLGRVQVFAPAEKTYLRGMIFPSHHDSETRKPRITPGLGQQPKKFLEKKVPRLLARPHPVADDEQAWNERANVHQAPHTVWALPRLLRLPRRAELMHKLPDKVDGARAAAQRVEALGKGIGREGEPQFRFSTKNPAVAFTVPFKEPSTFDTYMKIMCLYIT